MKNNILLSVAKRSCITAISCFHHQGGISSRISTIFIQLVTS